MRNPVPAPRRPRPAASQLLHEIRCLITDLPMMRRMLLGSRDRAETTPLPGTGYAG